MTSDEKILRKHLSEIWGIPQEHPAFNRIFELSQEFKKLKSGGRE